MQQPGEAAQLLRGSSWSRIAQAAMSERWLLRIAVVSMLAIYAQTLLFDFVYDDSTLILLNPLMSGWNHVHTIFTSTFWSFFDNSAAGGADFYRPFTMMWLFLVNRIGHGAPGFFHLGVVLTHLMVMLEIYLLGRRLTGDATAGALAALLFGIHPTHIESVAWIAGISDVLCAVFFLAALLAYLRWTDGDGVRWLVLSLACLESALLSKEAAALLVVLIVLDRFRQFRTLDWLSRCVHAVYVSLPYIVLSGLHFAWVLRLISRRNVGVESQGIHPSAVLSPYVLWWYLKKQVLPVPVSTHYPTIQDGGLTALQIGAASLFCLIVMLVAWSVVRRSRAGQLLVALFALTLLPVVLSVQTLQLHDRYLYLPGIAISIGAAVLLRKDSFLRERPQAQFVLVLAITAVLVPLGYVETTYWNSDVQVFEHSLRTEPHTVLNMEALSSAYAMLGDTAHEEQILTLATVDFPQRSRQWTRLAGFCLGEGRLDEAEAAALRAISLPPANKSLPSAFEILGRVALKRGNLADAETWATRAVIADGSRASAHRSLAAVYEAEGRTVESLTETAFANRMDAMSAARQQQ